ncbi:H(+)-transporting V1 sector ATPase subunit A [Onygenales sp. PD_40]|nr:H(+)-transporting V1 sector ATPase subunit A [Onygenales sp. PD_40]
MTATSINSLINAYTWSTLTVNPQEVYSNPVYQRVLGPDKQTFESICQQFPLEFAPNLLDTLTASDPPLIDCFKTLPVLSDITERKAWGVYTLLPEKDGAPPNSTRFSRSLKLIESDEPAAVSIDDDFQARQTMIPRLIKAIESSSYPVVSIDQLVNAPVYQTTLAPDNDTFYDLYDQLPLMFLSNLLPTFTAPNPPAVGFFKSLPRLEELPKKQLWGIYCILMEKDGAPPKLYIGSGTDSTGGLPYRFKSYRSRAGTAILCRVRDALKNGYKVSNHHLSCWLPIPPARIVLKGRARLIAVQAMFTFLFFAIRLKDDNGGWNEFWPWKWNTVVSWQPLCTHNALKESCAANIGMTPEELEERERKRVERRKDLEYRRMAWATNKNGYADKARATVPGRRAHALATKRYACDICDVCFTTSWLLKKHAETEKHHEAVHVAAGGNRKPVSARTEYK